MKPFLLIFFFVSFKVFCQSSDSRVGFKPYPLPKADRYISIKRMSVNSLGSDYSTGDDCIVIFGDEFTFENVYLNRRGGNAKHLLIIANTITIGSNNSIISQSDIRSGGDPDGGSVILICKKLVFETGSSIFFLGTAINCQRFKIGTQPPNYIGSYGAQLLFAAERIEVTPELRENVVNDHISAYDKYVKYVMENDDRTTVLKNNVLKIYLSGNENNLGRKKYNEYKNILDSQGISKEKIVEIAHQLRSVYFQEDHGLNDLIRYDIKRKWRSSVCFPLTSFLLFSTIH